MKMCVSLHGHTTDERPRELNEQDTSKEFYNRNKNDFTSFHLTSIHFTNSSKSFLPLHNLDL